MCPGHGNASSASANTSSHFITTLLFFFHSHRLSLNTLLRLAHSWPISRPTFCLVLYIPKAESNRVGFCASLAYCTALSTRNARSAVRPRFKTTNLRLPCLFTNDHYRKYVNPFTMCVWQKKEQRQKLQNAYLSRRSRQWPRNSTREAHDISSFEIATGSEFD